MTQFTLSAFGDEISPDLNEQIRVLKTNGIAYLECRSISGQVIINYPVPQVEAFYRQLSDEGVAVSAVGSPIGKTLITENFAPQLERFKNTLAIAHALHSSYIRMFSFYIPAGEAPAIYRQAVLERWAQFIETAHGSGLVLLHENESGIYGDTAERCLDLLDSLNSPMVKATFDPANFVQCEEETYPKAFKMLQKHIAYLHIKDALRRDHSVVPAGQGDGHLAEILAGLKKAGFEGFLSIEPHLNDNLPGGGPARFAIAANALKSLLANI